MICSLYRPRKKGTFISSSSSQSSRNFLTLAALIIAGEIIFSLPFHIPRFFRPTLLEVFDLSNTQLGDIFALYGIIAMLAYFPGGTIADHFSARKLMTASLCATALGGFYLYTLPSLSGLLVLFAYWGLTSILLFWAAMIKATREWAGPQNQGLAFGFLDGGRGLVGSIAASIAVIIFGLILSDNPQDIHQQRQALQSVILFYCLVTLLAALIIWLLLTDPPVQPRPSATVAKHTLGLNIRKVLRNKSIWLQAGIVITAYCGFKSLDNYGLYAVQVLGMDAVESATFITYASYSRPIAAIAAGLLADRWQASKMILTLFAIATAAFLSLSMIGPSQVAAVMVIANLLITFIAIYALRGIYFTLLEESQLDGKITGTSVGLISAVGFTPDIFFGPITGRILDANPGLTGFQHYFLLMALVCVAGLLLTYLLSKHLSSASFTEQDREPG